MAFPYSSSPTFTLRDLDDGSGTALYAGGNFTEVDGISANRIARWDGERWSALGNGVDSGVQDIALFDDGGGPMIYVDGTFTEVGGCEANHIARWDGAAWSSVGAGTNGSIRSLVVFDGGGGAALHAGGTFSQAGGEPASRIARWDGATWSALDGGVSGGLDSFAGGFGKAVYSLETCRDGARAGRFVGDNFHRAGNLPAGYIAR